MFDQWFVVVFQIGVEFFGCFDYGVYYFGEVVVVFEFECGVYCFYVVVDIVQVLVVGNVDFVVEGDVGLFVYEGVDCLYGYVFGFEWNDEYCEVFVFGDFGVGLGQYEYIC